MSIKKAVVTMLKVGFLVVTLFLSFAIAASVAGLGGGNQSPEAASQAAMSLLGVCVINTLLVSYLIVRAKWSGWRLLGAVMLIFFGIETFMSQIETLFFGQAFDIPSSEVQAIILSGFLRVLFFTPVAVLVWGKRKASATQSEAVHRLNLSPRGWLWRLSLLPLVYLSLYFLFGYFVAWQSADVRLFYSGSTAIEPFFSHMAHVVQDNPVIFPFQIVRGFIWIGLVLFIIQMMPHKPGETAMLVGLLFGLLLTVQLLLPNPYMPPPVRLAHFVETSTSTFIFGWLAAWLFSHSYTVPNQQSSLNEPRFVSRSR